MNLPVATPNIALQTDGRYIRLCRHEDLLKGSEGPKSISVKDNSWAPDAPNPCYCLHF